MTWFEFNYVTQRYLGKIWESREETFRLYQIDQKRVKNNREQAEITCTIRGHESEGMAIRSVSFYHTHFTVGFCTELSSCDKRVISLNNSFQQV